MLWQTIAPMSDTIVYNIITISGGGEYENAEKKNSFQDIDYTWKTLE